MVDFFGLYLESVIARTAQQAKTISTIILKAKALVVINGKKKGLETKKGMNGIAKRPTKIVFLSICLFMNTIVSQR